MKRWLELNQNNVVVNIIIWDGKTAYNPDGITLMSCEDNPNASFGWKVIDGEWSPPETQE